MAEADRPGAAPTRQGPAAPGPLRFQRRAAPIESVGTVFGITLLAILVAFLLAGLLFLPYGINPLRAYADLFATAFGTVRGVGFTLVEATPLILVALATIVAWRSGFAYLGYEGCLLIGAASAAWLALAAPFLPPALFFPAVLAFSFAAGGIWAALVGVLRVRFGGNEVLVSLMSNYVAALLVQYLVSGPMRAPGDLPQTPRLPMQTWLPDIIAEGRTHAGILLAVVAAALVWVMLRSTPLGFELIAAGLNPRAARYGGIPVGRRQILAAGLAGGLAALAGLCQVLGVQHRLMDGLSAGTGFVGIVVALLARLHPLAVIPTAILYGGLKVGADAMQRRSGVPSAAIFILQSLTVLLILGSDLLRHWRIVPSRSRSV